MVVLNDYGLICRFLEEFNKIIFYKIQSLRRIFEKISLTLRLTLRGGYLIYMTECLYPNQSR